ncbi:MAG: DHHA1 domain-containing protein, partial [Burkholderiaceae bacterium]
DALKGKLASSQGDELLQQAQQVGDVHVLVATLPGADAKALRDTLDQLKQKLKSAAVLLVSAQGDKVQLAAGVTADVVGRLRAGEWVNHAAQAVGGKGGGKPDMAMAGGTQPANVPKALEAARQWAHSQLQ